MCVSLSSAIFLCIKEQDVQINFEKSMVEKTETDEAGFDSDSLVS
jgi:hypothetical protein